MGSDSLIEGKTRQQLVEAAESASNRRCHDEAARLWQDALTADDVVPATAPMYKRAIQSQFIVWNLEVAKAMLMEARRIYPADSEWDRLTRDQQIRDQVTPHILADWPGCVRISGYRQRAPTRQTVVTFATLYTDIDTPAFSFPFLLAQGWDHIHVAQAKGTQYQNLTPQSLLHAVQPWLEGRDIWTYGSSLGGYAAIYYAAALGARAIASSPSLPAHPKSVRFPRDKVPIQHTPLDLFQTRQRCYIFFDPEDAPDSLFVRSVLLPGCKNAVVTELPFAGHQALRQLASAGLLKSTIRHIIQHAPDSLELDSTALTQTAVYWGQRAEAYFRNKQWSEAIEAGNRSLGRSPTVSVSNLVLKAMLRAKRLEEARTLHADVVKHFGEAKIVEMPK